MEVFNSLAPVFLIVALGVVLRVLGFLTPPAVESINKLVYWVGLPCLLFEKVARARVDLTGRTDAIFAVLAVTTLCLLAAWFVGRLQRMSGPNLASLVHAAFRGNLAFVGLAVLFYSRHPGAPDPMPLGVIVLTCMVAYYNVVGVTVLLLGRHRFNLQTVLRMPLQLAANPLILSSVGGLLFVWLKLPLPTAAARTLEALGEIGLPLALLAIGATLNPGLIRRHVAPVLGGSLIKVLFAPLAGWLLARSIGLDGVETRIALVFLACPTAAAAYVLADQLGGDRELTAGIVALSTLLSTLSLSAAIALS
jgi:hypothetical protein